MNIVVAGHVDHGKSTVIGRLLADTHTLPDGKIEGIRELCRRTGKPFEYAFLLDALKDERAQGITIDTARCFFETDKRKYIIIDAPGHIEFLKNMITGASRADAALLVIDAAEGICENSRRHGYMLEMLGIRQIAVLVNKIDLVGYGRAVFEDIRRDYTAFLSTIGIEPAVFIPVSAMEGDNIASHSDRTPWYAGPDVLEQLDRHTPCGRRRGVLSVREDDGREDARGVVHGRGFLPEARGFFGGQILRLYHDRADLRPARGDRLPRGRRAPEGRARIPGLHVLARAFPPSAGEGIHDQIRHREDLLPDREAALGARRLHAFEEHRGGRGKEARHRGLHPDLRARARL